MVRQTGVTLPLLEVLKGVGRLTGLFSVPAMLEAAGLLLAGFLLYCSLSAIGGSMAGKAEDLSSTNVLFSLVLVASFFCCMFAGGMDGMTSSARWLDYVPFTAILVTPSRVLLGQTSLLGGLVSLALVVVCAGVLTALAGRVYRLMSLYKGNPPHTPAGAADAAGEMTVHIQKGVRTSPSAPLLYLSHPGVCRPHGQQEKQQRQQQGRNHGAPAG